MPDSPPQSRSHHEQRFAIGVTRVCLTSGTLQIPFAMRGVFEPGTYPVLDVERDDTSELVFDPPRSLRGLDEIFTAHELQPNDEVILTITDDGLELEVTKRPRRKAPQAKGERWESVSGRQATASDSDTPAERVRLEGGQPQLFDEAAVREAPSGRGGQPPEHEDDGAPRIVRARRIGGEDDRPRMPPLGQQPPDAEESGHHDAAPAGRSGQRESAARRFFEDPGDPEDPYSADAISQETWQWERDESDAPAHPAATDPTVPASGGFFAKIAQAARGAFSFRDSEDDESGSRETHPPRTDMPRAQPEPGAPRGGARDTQPPAPREAQPRRQEVPDEHDSREREASPRPRGPQPESAHRSPTSRPAPASEPAPAPRSHNVVVEEAEADTMDRSGPAMWELGEGDLRQRLIRFLQHPDVPVILRTELVARNLGLGEEVAAAMLEDLSHDKIEGLVVTKVRDDTYRISRAPSKL